MSVYTTCQGCHARTNCHTQPLALGLLLCDGCVAKL
jgi:hypothetical protein